MAIREILQLGEEKLTQVCEEVNQLDNIESLVEDMRDTLNSTSGVGLAAPQIGVLKRIVLVKDPDTNKETWLINPVILEKHGKDTDREGCLSYSGRFGIVTRAKYVKIKAQDLSRHWFRIKAEGLRARIFQHEIDHLDGHMYTEIVERYLTDEEVEEMRQAKLRDNE